MKATLKKPALPWLLIFILLQISPRAAAVEGFGALDPSFSPVLNGPVKEIEILQDKRLVIWGDFTEVNGINRAGLAILNEDGTLDPTFDPGVAANGPIRCLELVWGQIFIGGDFTEFNGVTVPYLARLNLDGTVNGDFSPAIGPDAPVSTIASGRRPFTAGNNGDQTIILGGDFPNYDGQKVDHITMTELSGEPLKTEGVAQDPTLWLSRFRSESPVNRVAASSASIWFSGSFLNSNSEETSGLVLFLEDSTNPRKIPVNGPISEIEILEIFAQNGSPFLDLAVSGDFTMVNGVACKGLAIVGRDSSPDSPNFPVFAPDFPLEGRDLRAIYGIKVQPRSNRSARPAVQFILGGAFPAVPGQTARALTMWRHEDLTREINESPDSYPEEDFNAGSGPDGDVLSLHKDHLSRLYIGGTFTSYNGGPQEYLARTHGPRGSQPPESPSLLEGYVPREGQVALRWFQGDTTSSFVIERSPLGEDSWQEVGRISSKQFLVLNDQGNNAVKYRVRAENFNGLSLPGEFLNLNPSEPITSTGTQLDQSFRDSLPENLAVNRAALTPEGDLIILNNGFTAGEESFGRILKISPDGTMLENFISNETLVGGVADDLEILPDGRVLFAGNFHQAGDHPSAGIARFQPDGVVDESFTMAPYSGRIQNIGLFNDGRIALTGFFIRDIDGQTTDDFAILEADGSLAANAALPAQFTSGSDFTTGPGEQLHLPYAGLFGTQTLTGRIIRINSNGQPDLAFDNASDIPDPYDFAIDHQGRTLVTIRGGGLLAGTLRVLRFNRDGTPDLEFSPPIVPNQFQGQVDSLAVLPDGRILVAGNFWQLDDLSVPNVAVLLPNGSLDRTFRVAGIHNDAPVENLDIRNGNKLLVSRGGAVYLLSKSNADDTLPHTKFVIAPKRRFQIWQQMENLPAGSIDADSDGADDLLEYALRTSPTLAGEVPSLAFEKNNSRTIAIEYPRPDLDYRFERSTDLKNWSSDGLTITTEVGFLRVSIESESFIRLKVSLNN